MTDSALGSPSIDPVTAEVLRHTLLSIPRQIDANIARTAYTPLVYEYKDYAVGLVDPEGRLIAQGGGGAPIFVANALGVAVRDGLEIHGREGMEPGDLIFTNHAATLGQHLNNVVMYTPIHYEGEIAGFMAVLVHWIDVGGKVPGSASLDAASIYEEGVQFRSVKLCSKGRANKDIYRTIEANTRFPRQLMGDVDAQIAACLKGRDLTLDVLRKYGLADFREAVELMWRRSEAAARAIIRDIPDGEYSASSLLDDDGVRIGERLPVCAKVIVAGNNLTVDFSGMAAQVQAPINSGREGGAIAAARIAFKYLAAPDEPANEGAFRPLSVIAPDGTLVSASANSAMGLYSTILPIVVDTILKAMSGPAPERVAGGHHGAFQAQVYTGVHPKTGQLYQSLDTGHGGWGATYDGDGPGPYKTMVHGDTFGVPIEAQEVLYPIRVVHYRLWPDSGGAGKFRGGVGTERLVEALAPMQVSIHLDRTACPAWGVYGGHDGKPGAAYFERPGQVAQAVGKGVYQLEAGDRIRMFVGGGGGYGDPLEREPARVAADVALGLVSRRRAEADYGMIVDDGRHLD